MFTEHLLCARHWRCVMASTECGPCPHQQTSQGTRAQGQAALPKGGIFSVATGPPISSMTSPLLYRPASPHSLLPKKEGKRKKGREGGMEETDHVRRK